MIKYKKSLTFLDFLSSYTGSPITHVAYCPTSHVIVFKTTNSAELRAIKDELMADLNPSQQNEILELAWSEPYSFLFIDVHVCVFT